MTDNHVPLSPDRLPPAIVERLQMPLVMPMEAGPDSACGVFRADGSFRQMSRTLLSGARLSGIPQLGDTPFAEIIPGRWLFAGIGRHHFGHFVVETLIRLWALGPYRDELDGIVIVPKEGMDFSVALDRRYGSFLSMMSEGLPVHLAKYPTRYETLLLPSPGFGPLGWVAGTGIYRREIRARIARHIKPEGPERLYISRSALKQEEKQVHDEQKIEDLMRRAGYDIFHPQDHTIEEQLARYMAARTIVGGDGSAFHLAPFSMQPGSRVGLIQRRHRPKVFDAFTAQIEAFAQSEVSLIRPVLPKTDDTPHPSEAATPIDFAVVEEELDSAGFL
ncbi:glycosyltransferase family 61 protein [Roseovarius indicus]|uniref:glycosyltransferase family 61 protein n=1 Tax=Roseovarius indicus TaxID=540747 RepID=UPI0032EC7555